jgi:hypothetical protein
VKVFTIHIQYPVTLYQYKDSDKKRSGDNVIPSLQTVYVSSDSYYLCCSHRDRDSERSDTSYYTGHFVMFSVITNIYNKKTKGPTLVELFTATGKLKKFFFLQLEMFDVCTTADMAHIDTIFKFLPHTRQCGCTDILHCCNDPCRARMVLSVGGSFVYFA